MEQIPSILTPRRLNKATQLSRNHQEIQIAHKYGKIARQRPVAENQQSFKQL